MAKVIFNFLISPENKHRLGAVCDSNGVTMSSVLNGLIETYVINQTKIIEHRATQFDRLDAAIKATQKQRDYRQARTEPDFDDGPISPIYHDGSDFYDHNF
jgi:antitoxin component of RelBE/YafQ-DinJ toxin-antitoxin module